MELFEEQPHFVHSKDCTVYCDYKCNSEGFKLAEQIKEFLHK